MGESDRSHHGNSAENLTLADISASIHELHTVFFHVCIPILAGILIHALEHIQAFQLVHLMATPPSTLDPSYSGGEGKVQDSCTQKRLEAPELRFLGSSLCIFTAISSLGSTIYSNEKSMLSVLNITMNDVVQSPVLRVVRRSRDRVSRCLASSRKDERLLARDAELYLAWNTPAARLMSVSSQHGRLMRFLATPFCAQNCFI